jgi:putative hemolysin
MTHALTLLIILASLLLALVSFVQLLYLESLRLRTREVAALTYFKDTFQDRIGLQGDEGAVPFSLIKHALLVILGGLAATISVLANPSPLAATVEALLMGLGLMFLASYILPHLIYRRSRARWLLPLVPMLKILALTMKPVVSILRFFESVVKLAEDRPTAEFTPTPAEEIEALITVGTEEGIIEEDDRRLIHSVVALKDKTVRDSMTPRPRVVAISSNRSLSDLRQLVIHEQYSRIPVFEGTIDNVVGFVHVRDLFELTPQQQSELTIQKLARPIEFVPESKPVDDLLRFMQEHGAHMVIVVDEYGNTAGLATMEDLVEEIVGEIRDEHEPGHDVRKEGDNAWVVAGSFDVDRLRELVDYRGQDTESSTVGGLVTEWLGHVPKAGEAAERDGVRIEVLAGNELRVEQVRVSRVENSTHV